MIEEQKTKCLIAVDDQWIMAWPLLYTFGGEEVGRCGEKTGFYMKLSNNNATILMLDIHKDIEEYADFLVTKLLEEKDLEFLTYPPNGGLTEEEIAELKKLGNNEHLKSGLRKLVADNSAGVIFNMFNYFDGTGDPSNESGTWTGIKLVDNEPNKNSEPVYDMLHDKFYETYWEWRKIRKGKNWKLDMYEGEDPITI